MAMTHYELLDIAPDSTSAEIESALDATYNHWRLLVNHHVDEQRQEAQAKLRALEQARATLLDPTARARYNAQIVAGREGGLSLPPYRDHAGAPPRPPTPPVPNSAADAAAAPTTLDPSGCPDPECAATGNPSDARFCHQCRMALTQECPCCKRELRWYYKACTTCGCDIEVERRRQAEAAARVEEAYHAKLEELLGAAESFIRQGEWADAREVLHAFEELGTQRWRWYEYNGMYQRDGFPYGHAKKFEELPPATRLGWEIICPKTRAEWQVARELDAQAVLGQAREFVDREQWERARRILGLFEGLGLPMPGRRDSQQVFDRSMPIWQVAQRLDAQCALNDIRGLLRHGKWRSANDALAAFEGLGPAESVSRPRPARPTFLRNAPEWSTASLLASEVPVVRAALRQSAAKWTALDYGLGCLVLLGLLVFDPRRAYIGLYLALIGIVLAAGLAALVLGLVYLHYWGGKHGRLADNWAAAFSPVVLPIAAVLRGWSEGSKPLPTRLPE